ncbi:hypothetical protein D3C72_2125300 [compost metagenome]
MWQVVARNGDAAAPAIFERRAGHLREHLEHHAFQVRPILRPLGFAKRPASAHQQAALMVQPEVQQQIARVRCDVAFGKDARAHRFR